MPYPIAFMSMIKTECVWTRDNITGNSITYNDNGTGLPLSENSNYRFNVNAFYNDGRSWHYDNNFAYVVDPDKPIASNPSVYYAHWGRDQQYERYGLYFGIPANDPQGLGNIVSVVVATPTGLTYELFDDGQHSDNGAGDGYYAFNAWDLNESPVTGNYIFVITDAESNKDTAIYALNNTIDIPRNLIPVNNSLLTPETLTFSWDPVPGATYYNFNLFYPDWSAWSKNNITGTSVTFNDDGTAPALLNNVSYNFQVTAFNNDARSWHDGNNFLYASDPDKPLATNPLVLYNHYGTEQNERYGLQLRVNANDPQGLSNIVSVVAAAPAGFYTLYDDGQHWDNNPGDGILRN